MTFLTQNALIFINRNIIFVFYSGEKEMFMILVSTSENDTAETVCSSLSRAGYEPKRASSANEALLLIKENIFDMLILDSELSDIDGYELSRTLRTGGYNAPIIIVSSREAGQALRLSLISGADDCILKPVDREFLMLRVFSLMRRAHLCTRLSLRIGGITLDYRSMTVTKDGTHVSLKPKEFKLLYKLLSEPGRIFSRRELFEDIWGPFSNSTEVTVNVHINRLRNHFRTDAGFEIVTVRGIGYKANVRSVRSF